MTKLPRLLLLLASMIAQGGAAAADVFVDDFNDNQRDDAKWGPALSEGNAVLAETSQRLQFTIATPGLDGDLAAWPWLAGAPMDRDWEARVTVYLSMTPPDGAYTSVGMEIAVSALASERLFLELYRWDPEGPEGQGTGFLTSLETDDIIFGERFYPGGLPTAHLQMAFAAASKILTASVNTWEPINESQWQTIGTFGLGGSGGSIANRDWNLAEGGLFHLRIGGGSEFATVTAGQAWLDDFRLTVAAPPVRPEISIRKEGASVRISWPAAASEFALQSRGSAEAGAWTWESYDVTVAEGIASVLAPITGSGRVFRLSTGAPPAMKLIPAGPFVMGDTFGEGRPNELPLHTVNVSAFYMDETEVTRQTWDAVTTWGQANGYSFGEVISKGSDHPVCRLGWIEALQWCNARSEMEGKTPVYYRYNFDPNNRQPLRVASLDFIELYVDWTADGYRLPTEAEWEKAARGGAAGQRYAFGNTLSYSAANYRGNPTYAVGGQPYTNPAKAFAPNGFGLYGMTGNVWEWCWDSTGLAYAAGEVTDPRPPMQGNYRVARGGSWSEDSFDQRVACRGYATLDFRYRDHRFGFRCARRAP